MTKQARSKLAQQAQLALLYEVTCLNKPGLVDPVDAAPIKIWMFSLFRK